MLKIDMHVHTYYSLDDGISSPQDVLAAARDNGMDGVAITDHDSLDGAVEAMGIANGLLVIKGCEVSSSEGHILAYGIDKVVPKGLSAKETVDAIHAQGGLAVASHPYDGRRSGVGDLILSLPFDAVEAINGHQIRGKEKAMEICREHGFSMTAGTDAHMAKEVGTCYTVFDSPDIRSEILGGRTRVIGGHVTILSHAEHIVRKKILGQGK